MRSSEHIQDSLFKSCTVSAGCARTTRLVPKEVATMSLHDEGCCASAPTAIDGAMYAGYNIIVLASAMRRASAAGSCVSLRCPQHLRPRKEPDAGDAVFL